MAIRRKPGTGGPIPTASERRILKAGRARRAAARAGVSPAGMGGAFGSKATQPRPFQGLENAEVSFVAPSLDQRERMAKQRIDAAFLKKDVETIAKDTKDWQASLVGVGLILAKVKGVFGQITGAAKATLLVSERIAGMQHIVLGATEKITQAWLMVASVVARVFSLVEIIPSEIMAGVIAAGALLAVVKAIAIVISFITWPVVIIGAVVAAAAALFFWLSEARKESDAIKGAWIDITQIWKNATQQGFLQPQTPNLQTAALAVAARGVSNVAAETVLNWWNSGRDPRREPLPDNDDGL